MLPNLPPRSTQIPNNAFSHTDTPATFDRLAGVLTPNVQLEPNPSEIGAPAKWVRPADWLTLPGLNGTQEKFVGLFAVYDTDSNFLAFSFNGDFIVDWGDGHTEYFNSGDKAQHAYRWDRTPSSTQTSRGYRQVIVTVTPQSGNHLTSMSLNRWHDNVAIDDYYYVEVPWLDISVSMPNADSGDSIYFGTDSNSSMSSLEKVTIVNAGGCSDMEYLVGYNCRNLGEFNLLSAPNLEYMYDMFYNCVSLKNVNICNLPAANDMEYMFQGCYSLEHIELTGLSSVEYLSDIFYDCYALKSVKMSGLVNVTESPLYDLVSSYVDQPNTRSLTLEDLNSVENLDDAFYDWGSDFKGHLKLTGLTALTDIDYGLGYNYDLESVELYGLTNATSAYETFYECYALKNVVLEGTEKLESTEYMFEYCYGLEKAPMFDTSAVTYMYGMFYDCNSLVDVPLYDTSKVEDMGYMFYDCYSLKTIPQFDTSSVEYFYDMFEDCYSLNTIPLLDTSKGTDMQYMFSYCYALQKLPALDFSLCSNADYIFGSYCTSLGAAPFKNTATYISYYNCCLSRNAIVNIFRGLAPATEDIDVSYNYGVDTLTAEDRAIAYDKGWSVYY